MPQRLILLAAVMLIGLPTFRWPPEVIETSNRIEAEKARKRRQK